MNWTSWSVLGAALALLVSGCNCATPPTQHPDVEVIRPLKLTEAARIPQNDANFTSVEIFRDRLVLHYSAAPTIALAEGNVIAGNSEGGYLRRIKTVTTVDSRTLEVTTEPAELVDLILEGSFRVHHRPDVSEWQDGDIRRRADPLESKLGLLPPGTKSGFQCGGTAAGSVDVEPSFETDLDFDLAIDIEAQVFPPRGRLVSALFVVNGAVTVTLDIKSDVAFSGQCTADIIKYLRDKAGNKDLFKKELTPIQFAIGPVPIVISHGFEPTLSIQTSLEWTARGMHANKSTTFSVRAGAQYVNGGWEGIWEPDRTGTITMNQTGEAGTVTIGTQVAGGIQYMALLYDVAGPKVGLEGTLEGTFAANPTTCAWGVGLEAGLNLVLGAEVQVPLFDYKLADYTQTYNLLKKELSKAEGTFDGCGGTGGGGGLAGGGGGSVGGGGGGGGGGATGGGAGGTECTTSDASISSLRQVLQLMTLESAISGGCYPLLISLILHSSASVPSKSVAHDHTTLVRYVLTSALLQLAQVNQLFNTNAQFPCGAGPNGRTLCRATPVDAPAGDYLVISSAYELPIPLADPVNYYQYGFVFDADAVTTNNYQPGTQYPNDFFKDTDRWYTADYTPVTQTWSLKVVDASGGMIRTVTDSNARLIMKDNSLTLVVPASEFTTMKPSFRLTAFRHAGDYGVNSPYNYDGSLWPSVGDGLQPIF